MEPAPPLFSHCELPPWHLASVEFQDNPRQLELGDVAVTDRRLWAALDAIAEPADRARYFHDYVSVKFSLHAWSDPSHSTPARTALRHSYVHCLRHWGVDSNGRSGAALKAWVNSRFGLRPLYHTGLLDSDAEARARYDQDRMRVAAYTAGLSQQLDLLYTFCQRELARRHPGARWLSLYRGTHDSSEYKRMPEATGTSGPLVEFNNLSSFTSDSEVAWEFGSSVWRVSVPHAKILCFNGLLPAEFLQGESEYLVIGGVYRAQPLRG